MCGGVSTDLLGRTNILDLYACGETTCTGVHGGNRLASNSLLECLVFSHRIADDIRTHGKLEYSSETKDIPAWNKEGTTNTEEWVLISHDLVEIKTIMSNYVGIVRSDMRLERALRRLKLISEEVKDYYNRTTVSIELLELRNLVKVAELIVRSAILRKESRGLHFSTDYPEDRSPSRIDTILQHFLNVVFIKKNFLYLLSEYTLRQNSSVRFSNKEIFFIFRFTNLDKSSNFNLRESSVSWYQQMRTSLKSH